MKIANLYEPKFDDFRFPWKPWKSTFLFWPQKSIEGKILIGLIYTRRRIGTQLAEPNNSGYQAIYSVRLTQYATKKEIFEANLKGTIDNNVQMRGWHERIK